MNPPVTVPASPEKAGDARARPEGRSRVPRVYSKTMLLQALHAMQLEEGGSTKEFKKIQAAVSH